jgi:putative membrane protein
MDLITRKRETRIVGVPLRTVLLQLAISSGALVVAAQVVQGIYLAGWPAAVVAGARFALVNLGLRAAFRPATTVLRLLTRGLFSVVVNLVALAITAWSAGHVGRVQFRVDGVAAALLGALLITVLTAIATRVVEDTKYRR